MIIGPPKGPIQRNPRGLLSLFELKQQSNPSALSDEIKPTLELLDWYMHGEAQNVYQSAAGYSEDFPTAAAGQALPFATNPITVPANEIWYVTDLSLYVGTTAAGDAITVYSAIRFGPSALDYRWPSNEYKLSVSGANNSGAVTERDVWVPPGSEFRYAHPVATVAAANNIVVRMSVRALRLRI